MTDGHPIYALVGVEFLPCLYRCLGGGKALRAPVAPSGPSDGRKPLPIWAKSQKAKSQKSAFSHLLTSKLNLMHSPATTHH